LRRCGGFGRRGPARLIGEARGGARAAGVGKNRRVRCRTNSRATGRHCRCATLMTAQHPDAVNKPLGIWVEGMSALVGTRRQAGALRPCLAHIAAALSGRRAVGGKLWRLNRVSNGFGQFHGCGREHWRCRPADFPASLSPRGARQHVRLDGNVRPDLGRRSGAPGVAGRASATGDGAAGARRAPVTIVA